ncbi:MAG: hypothetical protein ACUVRM_00965 [Bacillota bacterium]
MKRLWTLILALALVLAFSYPALAAADWKTLKTEHFTVFYKPGFEEAAWNVLATLEYYRPAIEELVGNELFHLPVVIEDTGRSTAFTDILFRYHIHFSVTPPPICAVENWCSQGVLHEYIHSLVTAKRAGLVKFLQAVFGNVVIPNYFVPGWITEGITTFGDSQLTPYQGPLNDGYFDAYIGACVRDGRLPSILKATYSPLEEYPPGGIYLFGGEFFNYLAKTYGRDKFARFFTENGGNIWSSLFVGTFLPGLGVDASAKKVYGKSFPALWQEWQDFERERFKDFRMEGERVTQHGWYVKDPKIYRGKLYYRRGYPVATGEKTYYFREIVVRDLATGKEETLFATTSSFAMPSRIHGDKLYYALLDSKSGFANVSQLTFGEYTVLHARDLATGEDRVVLAGEMRAFAVLEDGTILYAKDKKDSFGSELHLFDPATKEDRLLAKVDYLVEEIVAGGGRVVVSAHQDWSNSSLYALSLADLGLTPLVDMPFVEAHPSLQGDRLFFSSNYGGVYAAYCYDFASGKTFRLTENGYAASPVLDEETGQIYYVGLTSAGFDLYRKEAVYREFTPEDLPRTQPPALRLDESRVTRGDYIDNLKTLAPAVHLPLFATTGTGPVLGATLIGADAIGHFPYYQATLAFRPADKQLVYDVMLYNYFSAPLQTALRLANDLDADLTADTPVIEFAASYPLRAGYGPGLNGLALGVSTLYFPEDGSWSIAPSASVDLSLPRADASLELRMPLYSQGGASVTGLYADFKINRFLLGGDLALRGNYFTDPIVGGEIAVRGMAPFATETGLTAGAQYSRVLLRINDDLWNPNVFLEDLYADLFWDGALDAARDLFYYSWGAELHLQGKIAMFFPLDAYLRCLSANGGPFGLEYGLSIGLPF